MRLSALKKYVEDLVAGGGGGLNVGSAVERPNPDLLRGGAGGPNAITPLTPTRPNLVVAHFLIQYGTASGPGDVILQFYLEQSSDPLDPEGSWIRSDTSRGFVTTDNPNTQVTLTALVPAGINYYLIDQDNEGTAPVVALGYLTETPL